MCSHKLAKNDGLASSCDAVSRESLPQLNLKLESNLGNVFLKVNLPVSLCVPCCICLGEQSIKDDDVLSEKINFSAPGGPKSTIFDTDDVDPLYFEVSIVSAPSDPPYMSKNGKMCYFYHFLRVPKKTYTQSTGLP